MQKQLNKLLTLCLIFSINANADQSIPIKQGQIAPFDGTLLDLEKSIKIREQLLDRDLYLELNKSYEKSLDLYKSSADIKDKQINVLLEQNDKLAQSLKSSQSLSTLEKIGLFTLGVAVTIASGLAIHAIAK